MPTLFPIGLPGFLLGGLVSMVVFFLLFLLVALMANRGKDSAAGAFANWLLSYGPLFPWLLAFAAAVVGAAIAFAFFRD